MKRSPGSIVLMILCILAAAALFWVVLQPFDSLKHLADALMPDGNFKSLDQNNWIVYRGYFAAGILACLALAALLAFRRIHWADIRLVFKHLGEDARAFFRLLKPGQGEGIYLVTLAVITGLAVIFRLEYLNGPMMADESYTYLAFGWNWRGALMDYHLPNNHVFHSLLVYLFTQVLGNHPWAIRLPAFLAGVLIVPAIYFLAKTLYDRATGLASALLAAFASVLIYYSTQARGYTLVGLFTLLTLLLGNYVRREKNLFAWLLLVFFSALGFYTVPVMLFPFGMLFAWMFFENLAAGPVGYRSKVEFLKYWLAAGFGTVGLTVLLYTPILIYSGPEKLLANDYIAAIPWRDYLATLADRLRETWAEWTSRFPVFLLVLLGIGLMLGLVFYRRIATQKVPLILTALSWSVALLAIQRPNVWSKIWFFLVPLALMWSAAGITGLLKEVRPKLLGGVSLAMVVVGAGMLAALLSSIAVLRNIAGQWQSKGSDEMAVSFLKETLQEGDIIAVSSPDDAPVWYYARLYGIPDSYFDVTLPARQIFVLVDTYYNQTLDYVIFDRGPDNVASVDTKAAVLVNQSGPVDIYLCPINTP